MYFLLAISFKRGHIARVRTKQKAKNLTKAKPACTAHSMSIRSRYSASFRQGDGRKKIVHKRKGPSPDPSRAKNPYQSTPYNFAKWHPESQALWLSWMRDTPPDYRPTRS